jgi:hypothetical protein
METFVFLLQQKEANATNDTVPFKSVYKLQVCFYNTFHNTFWSQIIRYLFLEMPLGPH